MKYRIAAVAAPLLILLVAWPKLGETAEPQSPFHTSDRCVACHNGMTSPSGEDLSIGLSWRTSMMANAALDPYWQAGVRREIIDHPMAKAHIENECSTCHMPMAHLESLWSGKEAEVFSNLGNKTATDGVSCSLCHQITPDKLGTRESLVGKFVINQKSDKGERPIYGPYKIDAGHTRIMRTSTGGFRPTEGIHIQKSELCATCHTLLTKALNAQGQVIGELPEQVPYQEWLHSEFREKQSCQDCHMPKVKEDVPITVVLGAPRAGFSRHQFLGGNFFIQRMLGRYRTELGTDPLQADFDNAANRTIAHLQNQSAQLRIENVNVQAGSLNAEIAIDNLGGHKLPTAYPARRVWLHVTVRDNQGRIAFESGALNPNGSIQGNDSDADGSRFEPHYRQVSTDDQVQIYESVMGDAAGVPTTGLLSGVRFLKDNRLLPRGFNKQNADKEIAVVGDAQEDPDFAGGSDRVRYSVSIGNGGSGNGTGPYRVEAELLYQPIAYRWANNLKRYDSMETKRFTRYYDEMSGGSAVVLARTSR